MWLPRCLMTYMLLPIFRPLAYEISGKKFFADGEFNPYHETLDNLDDHVVRRRALVVMDHERVKERELILSKETKEKELRDYRKMTGRR